METNFDSSNLIIIASQPRSGSTLLQALLSNNDKIATVSEPWLLLPFISYNRVDLNRSVYNSKSAIEGISDFKNKLRDNSFDDDLARFLLNQYQKILVGNESYVLDKTPRYYEILDEIVSFFPNAKVIVLKRNPFAVLSSIISTWDVKMSNLMEFKRDILEAPFILDDFRKKHLGNPNVRSISYEDLVSSPEENIKALFNWIGIQELDVDLDFSDNNKYLGYMGDPTGVKKMKTPSMESIDKWKRVLKDKKWNSFFQGYADYLGTHFLKEYGGYSMSPKRTEAFQNFLFETTLDNSATTLPTKRLVKYLSKRLRKKLN